MARMSSVAIATAALVLGCTDGMTNPHTQQRDATAAGVAAAVATDPGINTSDTWVQGSATEAETTFVHSDQSFADPTTGQQTTDMTLAEPAYPVSYVSGYGYDGVFRGTSAFDAAEGTETQTVQQIGNGTGDADVNGVASTDALDREPITDLGDLTYAQVDPSGGSGGGTGCPNNEITCNILPPHATLDGVPPSPAVNGWTRTITHIDGTHYRAEDAADSTFALPAGRGNLSQLHRKVRIVREFELRNGKWLIQHMMHEISVSSNAGTITQRHHHVINQLNFHINTAADSVRRLRQLAASATVSAFTPGLITPVTSRRGVGASHDVNPCITIDTPDACGGSSSGTSYGYQDPPPPDNTTDVGPMVSRIVRGSPYTIVMQHGFISSPSTWGRMDDWLSTDMAGISTIRPKLDWTQTYENQAVQLGYTLRDSAVPGQAILIGHSNGGMVERYLAENPYIASGVNLAGVVTVGTPHRGAPLARYARDMNRMLGVGGVGALIVCAFPNEGGCERFLNVMNSGLNAYYKAFEAGPPVLNEMQPTDQYHSQFNSTPESFQRYGIESYGWNLWKFWSEFGGAYAYSDSRVGDYAQVKKTDRTYHHDVTCSVIGLFTFRYNYTAGCAADAVFLKAINNVYNRYTETSGNGGRFIGDGIVPAWSQPYPNIPDQDQYPIYDGPAHLSETSSKAVGEQIETILVQHFGVQQLHQTP